MKVRCAHCKRTVNGFVPTTLSMVFPRWHKDPETGQGCPGANQLPEEVESL